MYLNELRLQAELKLIQDSEIEYTRRIPSFASIAKSVLAVLQSAEKYQFESGTSQRARFGIAIIYFI